MVCSIARSFGAGSAPGCARHTGQVRVFSGAPYSSSQRQNIFVRVFRCACTSRPMTASYSGNVFQPLLRLAQRLLDVLVRRAHPGAMLEGPLGHDEPDFALARLDLELHLADKDGARAVEHARLG